MRGKVLIGSLILAGAVFAQPSEEVKQLREEIEVLKEEIRKLKLEMSEQDVKEYKSYSGLGPAASKALINPKGVSVGGYGEVHFINTPDKKPNTTFDAKRLIMYFGYSFSEKLKFNSEIEWEHAFVEGGEESGEIAVEFAFVDYRHSKAIGLRGGMLLIPVGIVNEFHEPPTFYTVDRPYLERNIIPTTWRENGFGVYGDVGMVSYRAYIINGMKAEEGEFKASAPLKKLRQKASLAVSDKLGFTGRVDVNLPKNLKVGASTFIAGVQDDKGKSLGTISLFSPHLWWQYAGFDVRFVGVYTTTSGADKITAELSPSTCSVDKATCKVFPKKIQGFYLQVAYNVLRFTDLEQELYLFGMYESYDTHVSVPAGYSKPSGHKVNIYNFGLSYKPHPLIAIKADYVKESVDGGEDKDLYRAAISWMF